MATPPRKTLRMTKEQMEAMNEILGNERGAEESNVDRVVRWHGDLVRLESSDTATCTVPQCRMGCAHPKGGCP
jgi:hypothetical protein